MDITKNRISWTGAFRSDVLKLDKIQAKSSSLAKGFAHGPLSLHPLQIELDFVITTNKDDITFDQWVLLTVSCSGRCIMDAPNVYIFDCIHLMFSLLIVRRRFDWTQLVVPAFNKNRAKQNTLWHLYIIRPLSLYLSISFSLFLSLFLSCISSSQLELSFFRAQQLGNSCLWSWFVFKLINI